MKLSVCRVSEPAYDLSLEMRVLVIFRWVHEYVCNLLHCVSVQGTYKQLVFCIVRVYPMTLKLSFNLYKSHVRRVFPERR